MQFSVTWYLIARLSFLTTSGRTSGNLLSLEMEMMLLGLDLRLMSPNNEVTSCRCPKMGEPQSSIFSNRFPKFLPRNLAKFIMFAGKFPSFLQLFQEISQNIPKFILSFSSISEVSSHCPPKSARFPHSFRGFGPLSPTSFANPTPHAPRVFRVFQGHGQPQRGVGQEVVPRPRNA